MRPATIADAAALAGLATQLGYASTPLEVEVRLALVVGDSKHLILTAECAGSIVGWAHAYLGCLVESDPYVELGGLVVDESHRGSGVGSKLTENVENWARQNACLTVTVRSNVIRHQAHGFYAARGYAQIKTQHVFRKQL